MGYNSFLIHRYRDQFSLHAEIDACKKLMRNKHKFKHYAIYIVRIDKEGNLCPTKPCEQCKKALIKFQFKNVYYWTG
jgi:deoxycytidylate deaminase